MSGITILAIESSCDDTSAALLKDRVVLSNVIANQDVHEKYGGVVPEMASRAHQSNIIPVVQSALDSADVSLAEVDAIAYTNGPGLIGSLMVGSSFAKGLSVSLGKPLVQVDHMRGHVLAHLIEDEAQKNPPFPFLCLTVSGGHTQILVVKSPSDIKQIGSTIDDAAGEALDKGAKLLGLPYPGGPHIDRLAKNGQSARFQFTIPSVADLNFSFSGLKTSLLYFLKKETKLNPDFISENLEDLCASYQAAVIKALMQKLSKAVAETGIYDVAVAGGVSANSALRATLKSCENDGWNVYIPKLSYCTDNAAMIGIVGYFKFLNGDFGSLEHTPKARTQL